MEMGRRMGILLHPASTFGEHRSLESSDFYSRLSFIDYLSSITHHPSPITHHPSPITHHPSSISHQPSSIKATTDIITCAYQVTAITTCGIYPAAIGIRAGYAMSGTDIAYGPGLSNVMAAATVRNFEKELEFQANPGENKAESLEFSYFTAGTGTNKNCPSCFVLRIR
eukprot:3941408-Rhodomonas_salina.3